LHWFKFRRVEVNLERQGRSVTPSLDTFFVQVLELIGPFIPEVANENGCIKWQKQIIFIGFTCKQEVGVWPVVLVEALDGNNIISLRCLELGAI
jgi:hypothetical protein